MYRISLLFLIVRAVVALMVFASAAQPFQARSDRGAAGIRVRPVSWLEISTVVERLSRERPSTLRDIPPADRPARWAAWMDVHRTAVTSRITQGDIDSAVNLLLFGTSFTTQPRLTANLLADLNRRWNAGDRSAEQILTRVYQRRAADLVNAAGQQTTGERMLHVRRVLEGHGYNLATASGRRTAIDYLLENVVRVRQEAAALTKQLEAVRAQRDATTAFVERSKVFRDRGLSADSSVLTQFAVDRALCALSGRGVVNPRSVAHVAIVGPGLDFTDKQEGFDFYDPQTLQPFTAIDSLMRCGLADARALRVTTIDVSPRVNGHIRTAVDRAAANRSYRLVLPWDSRAGWLDEAISYWRRAGDQVGKPFELPAPSLLPGVRVRGIAIRPEIIKRLHAVEGDIVTDRLDMPESQRFDLVIATNVLVYYDTFEQTLALASIAAMLRPGGVLLTNDAVLEVPDVPLHSEGYLTVPFSAREGDGERIIWYVRDRR